MLVVDVVDVVVVVDVSVVDIVPVLLVMDVSVVDIVAVLPVVSVTVVMDVSVAAVSVLVFSSFLQPARSMPARNSAASVKADDFFIRFGVSQVICAAGTG